MPKKKVFATRNLKDWLPSLPLKTRKQKKENQSCLSRQFCASLTIALPLKHKKLFNRFLDSPNSKKRRYKNSCPDRRIMRRESTWGQQHGGVRRWREQVGGVGRTMKGARWKSYMLTTVTSFCLAQMSWHQLLAHVKHFSEKLNSGKLCCQVCVVCCIW